MMLMLAVLLQAGAQPSSAIVPPKEVVVTGQRLSVTAAALAACVVRHCPPDEDVRATLAHAENQFIAGSYQDARATLLASAHRNRRHAKQYPVPVGDLMRANARVALHLGESDAFRINQIDSLDALKAGLPANDPRVLAQRLEVADAFARLGRDEAAMLMYRDIAADAHGARDHTVEGYALIRRAVLMSTIAAFTPAYRADARHAIDALIGNDDPGLAPFRAAARLLQARLDAKAGDPAAIDRLVATYATPGRTPQLLYAPPYIEQDAGRADESGDMLAKTATETADGQWVDLSFFIQTDGKVTDVSVLRQSAHFGGGGWVEDIEKTIAGRRYTPFRPDGVEPGMLRVERYTRTAYWLNQVTGTHLRQREAKARLEMLDLTAESVPATPAAARPANGIATGAPD